MTVDAPPTPAPAARRGRPGWLGWVACAAIVVVGSLPVTLHYLVFWPLDQWQVDVEVYRMAGQSIIIGRPVYDAMTESPQLLPSTYPPFAALLAIPLALVPFGVVGWLWTALQLVATTAIVWYAGWRLIHRAGRRAPILLGLLTVPMLWIQPVSDGIRFGQVNAFIVLACLMDLRRPRPRLVRGIPPGVLVGLATAIKLTPGVFVVHYAVNRRWREARHAVAAAALVTVLAWLLLPENSFAFWGGALSDPARLGPNRGTSNQSIRGVLLRIGPDGTAGTLVWLVLVAVVGVLGFRLARRMWQQDDSIGEVAVVGLLAVLLSPVAWIHHLHWLVVVVFALLGPDPLRDRRRLWSALLVTAWFTCRLEWWGVSWIAAPLHPVWFGRVLQNSGCLGALVALGLLWWVTNPRPASDDPGDLQGGDEGEEQADTAADAADHDDRYAGEEHPAEERSEA
ncbi:putative membrane protein [Nostocoides japonicum T1-X7]|uniref:Putative membrane protein n=1 Tax=Nostocoides japonicum T1-X7 TaxID=1194083 RepID=A0A077LWS7_9MICO|nr:putative membrane protein [Tetrasphaera japonica T1-X7]